MVLVIVIMIRLFGKIMKFIVSVMRKIVKVIVSVIVWMRWVWVIVNLCWVVRICFDGGFREEMKLFVVRGWVLLRVFGWWVFLLLVL